jgi:hypothetical protein
MPVYEERGVLGRVSAGLLGGFVGALAVAVALSVYYPHPDALNRLFAGGILFGPLWVGAMFVAFMARSGRSAWWRIGLPTLGFMLLDGIGFIGML